MASCPFDHPSALEQLLFEAGLVRRVSLAEIYDIKARTSIQRAWQDPEACVRQPNVHDPRQWYDKLHACTRGEFFVQALEGCNRILDVGCGEGWPSLYLARTFPHVTGIDLSPGHIALAQRSAEIVDLTNVEFRVERIETLEFADQEFDGVCFGGNVFTYDCDPAEMLFQLHRVLKTGGTFAFEQWPVDPAREPSERIGFFIDGGPPILHYCAGIGLVSRSYFIYIRPESNEGRHLSDLSQRMVGELSPEQRETCEAIKLEIENGELQLVEDAVYSGEDRSLSDDEFPRLLGEAGFVDVMSWALPDAVAFAQDLDRAGLLSRLRQEDLVPYLRALVKSSARCPGWTHTWVTCSRE